MPKKSYFRAISIRKKLVILALLLLTIAIVYPISHYLILKSSYDQRADKDCVALEEETLRDVAALGGYTVASHRKNCVPATDEMGGTTAYSNYIRARITIDNAEDADNLKAKLTTLRDDISAKAYNVNVQNIRASAGNPPALCLETFRYMDKTAQNYLWNGEPPRRDSQYVEPGVSYSDWRCEDL